ncbi:MAG: hemolysin family protein [Bacillota bacterium]|nr:hemolysin family protein [Bacillota bacterium]
MLGEILIIIVLILINAFFAAAEMSIVSLRELTLEKKASEGDKKALLLIDTLKEPSRFLATIQVGITLTSFFTSASAAVGLSKGFAQMLNNSSIRIFQQFSDTIAFVSVTFIISFISLLFGELIPKRIALKKSEKIASAVIGIIRIVNVVGRPLVTTLTFCTNFVIKLIFGDEKEIEEAITEEEVRMMINVGEEKGIFREMETKMINSIFEFDDTTVADIMTPRPDMTTLDIESSFEEVIAVLTTEKYSRMPVYKDDIDNIVGILYAKDIIDYMASHSKDDTFNLNQVIREPFFVTEYAKIDDLLKEMQKKNVHICIVIDEYGSTAGLATIEDMLEQIVGNIYDEYDTEEEEEINKRGDDEFEIDGGLNMSELNELLETEYPENYDTVSGLILDAIGRFPKEGESINIEDYNFKVLNIRKKRIKKILVKKIVEA